MYLRVRVYSQMYVLVVLAIKSRIADDGHSQNNLAIGQFNDPGSAPMHDMRHGRQSSMSTVELMMCIHRPLRV